MEAMAKAKYLRGSARKFRLIADMVRSKPVSKSISVLNASPQKASREIEKVIRAAAANLQSSEKGANLDIDDLVVKEITIDAGPSLKRIRPRAQGRAYRVLHRTSHIKVVLSD